jgi:hypothetical protein
LLAEQLAAATNRALLDQGVDVSFDGSNCATKRTTWPTT